MINFALAFMIVAIAYYIGDIVSTVTKAWVPSTFVTAICFIAGYWTFFPDDIVATSQLIPFGSGIGSYLCLIHMGSVISPKQLKEQWRTVVCALCGLAGMCLFCMLICTKIMDYNFVIAGLPPLTGGIIAAITMRDAAEALGLQSAALFAIAMYCMQGFAGYPLTAACLQIYGKSEVERFRRGEAKLETAASQEVDENGKLVTVPEKKKLITIPKKFDNYVLHFIIIGGLAFIATRLGTIKFPGGWGIGGSVWSLLLGILATTIGLLPNDVLHKDYAYNMVMFALMIYIFDGLKTATPELLGGIIGPMVLLIIIGVAGMALGVFIIAKIIKQPYLLALATSLTALYGFPPNAIITENTCRAIAQNDEEFDYLMSRMFPPMIVGGFTTVTITSVILAGIFASFFK